LVLFTLGLVFIQSGLELLKIGGIDFALIAAGLEKKTVTRNWLV